VLEQNMLHGTGVGAHIYGRTDAGKTGTTDQYGDAWFCGYTPNLEATVWIGYPRAEIPMLSVHGIAVSGPTFPAQIWHIFMESALGNRPDVPFPQPTTSAVWTSWHGQYEYGGASGPYTTSGPSYSQTPSATSTSQEAPPAAPTVQTVAPAPAPTPTQPAPSPPPPPPPTAPEGDAVTP